MTQIPSNLGASGAQAGFQAREIAKEHDARRVAQSDISKRQAKTVGETESTVETSDQDVAVFSDSEGGGSQGRDNLGEELEESVADEDVFEDGIVRDENGDLHLDLEA